MRRKTSAPPATAPILEELRERYTYARDEWKDIRDEGAEDMRYIAGDPWKQTDRAAREEAGRPCLTFDELGQYVNQVINDLRQNKRGIRVTARGFGATEQTARFRQGKIRDIEYTSNAQQAYTRMAQDAIQRSEGYFRIKAKYVSARGGFDQEPVIEPIMNPEQVLPDPDFIRTDGTDWKYLFFLESRSVKDFAREFPRAEKRSFTSEDLSVGGDWWNGKRLRLAEYWTKELARTRKLLLLKPMARSAENPNPQPFEVFDDELNGAQPSSDQILKDRAIEEFKVLQYLTNGFEILKTTPWPGQSIPFVGCYGKIIYVGGKRVILSMVRLARSPAMLLNYIRTSQMELVGMTPKFPYFYYENQLSADALQLLAKSLHEPVVGIPIKPTAAGTPPGVILPPPSRQPYEPAIQVLELLAESIRRSIQAAIAANFLPTVAQKQNEKSGKALQRIESSAQKGTYHFTDSYDGAVTRGGAILDEVIPAYFDTARDTSIRTPADDPEMVRINDPQAMKNGQPAHIPVDKGHQHDVTISVGPAQDSEREAASDFADTIVSNHDIANVIGPQKTAELVALAIKLKNVGPLGDQMADIISPKQQGDPKQIMQQAAQLQQENQQLKGALQQAAEEIKSKKLELDSKERIATEDNKTKVAIATLEAQRRAETAIAVAEISSKAKDSALFYEERARLGVQAADAVQAEHDRAHDVGLEAMQHAHALEAGAAAHDQALEAGDASHQQQLEQGAQAAALAPDPAEGAGA